MGTVLNVNPTKTIKRETQNEIPEESKGERKKREAIIKYIVTRKT